MAGEVNPTSHINHSDSNCRSLNIEILIERCKLPTKIAIWVNHLQASKDVG